MGTVIIACQTLQDELRMALKETGVNYPVFYIESGLHIQPDSLHRRIQEEINRIDNVELILLVFGYCGNSLMGVTSSQAKMVIAKVDDCIPLLLGSADIRKKISKEMGTYFITKGWLDYENNIVQEYERCILRYGEQRALKVMKTMLGHYKRFMLIDTGAYPVESVLGRTQDFAKKLNMQHEIATGSLRLLHKLLLGQWDDEFIILEPGQEITLKDICDSSEEQDVSIQLLAGLGGSVSKL
ncbi:MAG TPA: DUF1638 domain-containing protein [Negativicutes bacterium]